MESQTVHADPEAQPHREYRMGSVKLQRSFKSGAPR
jgi:hypothetical protein